MPNPPRTSDFGNHPKPFIISYIFRPVPVCVLPVLSDRKPLGKLLHNVGRLAANHTFRVNYHGSQAEFVYTAEIAE